MNLPNALTALRIFLVPLLVVVLLTRAEHHVFLGAGIFGLAALTDYLDGYFARRRNQITRVGILLDPLADKIAIRFFTAHPEWTDERVGAHSHGAASSLRPTLTGHFAAPD